MNNCKHKLVVIITSLTLFLLLSACGQSGPDLSTPEKAVKEFAIALDTGNLELAKSVCLVAPDSERMIASLVPLSKAMRELREVAKAKFGKDAGNLANGEDVSSQIARSKIKIMDDEATCIPTTGTTKNSIKLKKVDGKWKVDVKSMTTQSNATPENLKNMETLFKVMAASASDTAAAIKAGKFKNANEAQADLGIKMRNEMTRIQATDLKGKPTTASGSAPDSNGTAPAPKNEGGAVAPGNTGNSKKF
ncbi:MAG: hypothetical protein ABJA67_16315 [Chthonomonadales bacterium]